MVSIGLIFGALAIALGAFGAHALKKVLSPDALNTFETGVKYQMYHALFLLFLGTTTLVSQKTKSIVLYLIFFGVLFFSGSIYLLATKNITGINFDMIGIITPLGGLLLITAWTAVFINLTRKN